MTVKRDNMAFWTQWLRAQFDETPQRLRMTPQEERILRLAEWLEPKSSAAAASQVSAPAPAAAAPELAPADPENTP
jgi:hypothetical protein